MNMEWLNHRAGFKGLGIRRTGSNHWRQYMVSTCWAASYKLRYLTWRYTITNPLSICEGFDTVPNTRRGLWKRREEEKTIEYAQFLARLTPPYKDACILRNWAIFSCWPWVLHDSRAYPQNMTAPLFKSYLTSQHSIQLMCFKRRITFRLF